MRDKNHATGWWPLLLICLATGGCASTGAPAGWLPVADDAPQDPYGSWITVEFVKGHDRDYLTGEFLAVDSDSLYVLSSFARTGDPVIGVSLDTVKKANIASFDPQTNKAASWVAFGTLSCLSHGLAAGVTIPLWVILGSVMTGSHSRTPLENYPHQPWDELRKFARFPQGPPPSLHQLDLHPKYY